VLERFGTAVIKHFDIKIIHLDSQSYTNFSVSQIYHRCIKCTENEEQGTQEKRLQIHKAH